MFTHHLQQQTGSKVVYVQTILDMFLSGLSSTQLANECFLMSGVLDHWIDYCSRLAEYDGSNTLEERTISLVFLSDIWCSKPDFVDSRPDMSSGILTILKRSCRDKDKLLRIIAYEHIFRLFTTFAKDKVSHAPMIYKSITFLLVEYHMDIELREQMVVHFMSIFTEFAMIPISICVDPFVKQIQMTENYSFFWNIFDLDFFAVVSHHKRLTPQLAVQVLALLSNLALRDVMFASYAVSVVCQLVSRFSKDPAFCQEVLQISSENCI
jgi:hypothetical protein